MRRRISPAVVLFALAPAVGELLSGSSPPVESFNPFTFFLLAALYGGGAILVRELVFKWRKGWLSLFVLGAVYGIVEEGLMCKSFFAPNWHDLGPLGTYGRWAGVNRVWAQGLTVYHATFSIAIPILLVELAFPTERRRSWVSDEWLKIVGLLFALDIVLGFCCFPKPETPYYPSPLHVAGTVLVVVALVWLAKVLPPTLPIPLLSQVPSEKKFAALGFTSTVAFFVVFWGLPDTNLPPLVTMALGVLVPLVSARFVMRWSGNGAQVVGYSPICSRIWCVEFFHRPCAAPRTFKPHKTRQYCWHEFGWFGRFNRIGVAVATVGAMARQQPRGATERIRS